MKRLVKRFVTFYCRVINERKDRAFKRKVLREHVWQVESRICGVMVYSDSIIRDCWERVKGMGGTYRDLYLYCIPAMAHQISQLEKELKELRKLKLIDQDVHHQSTAWQSTMPALAERK